MANDTNKPTFNGVPINDAPISSNPVDADPTTKDQGEVKRQSPGEKTSQEPAATKDVTYDVPPADLKK